jgi:uncharacterized protein YcbK (DUF882 family)
MKTTDIIKIFIAAMFFISSPAPIFAQNAPNGPAGDGHLRLYNYHLNEYGEIKFRDDGGFITSAMSDIDKLFRSPDGKTLKIDPGLIVFIDEIQDHFGIDTVEIISGYRSPEYNKKLRLNGRGAASESLHTKGTAADIHIDEICEKDLYEYVANKKRGGAGYYPKHDFVHIDTGPVRSWEEPPATTRALIGSENNPNPSWSATTDKNIYNSGENLDITISNSGYARQRISSKRVWMEMFKRGQWFEHFKVKTRGTGKALSPGEEIVFSWQIPPEPKYGKYRMVIFPERKSVPIYSNEFYIKKRIAR